MFNKDSKPSVAALIEENAKLKERITTLEKDLVDMANTSGGCIIKQLPNGVIELNGEPIDKDIEVDYYNSSKATYSELTMYRVAKEAFNRDEKKLIAMHLEECDRYKAEIDSLKAEISSLNANIDSFIDNCEKLHKEKDAIRASENNTKKEFITYKENAEAELKATIERYESCIAHLNADIETWKRRYLTINNTTLDGTIITKYGQFKEN